MQIKYFSQVKHFFEIIQLKKNSINVFLFSGFKEGVKIIAFKEVIELGKYFLFELIDFVLSPSPIQFKDPPQFLLKFLGYRAEETITLDSLH